MKRVAVLGSTGSIGTQTLDVIAANPEHLKVVALAANFNHSLLSEQAAEFGVTNLAMFDEGAAKRIGSLSGIGGLVELATDPQVDVVVVSVAGMIGLEPSIAALKAGKQVALASKEVLVAGGEIVMPVATSETIRPIDSEHSAILQCLQGEKMEQVEALILTASGGPFRRKSREDLEGMTAADALNHPTWKMGGKITVDSASLMNKGLELIEACWLFGISPDDVEIVVHPQSVIHSMVRFADQSVIAQLGHPDMKLPIQYALLGPDRMPSPARQWDPMQTPNLTFEELDRNVFSLPDVAREAFRRGGLVPAWMNAVNEEAVNAFLRGETGFMDVVRSVESSLDNAPTSSATLESIIAADAEARARYRAA
ncbi:MAG: 1-deoxy-D-xylulose-5-phosphate reductoisomerase [Fimbriimonadales bacterium]